MDALVSITHGSKVETDKRHPSAGRKLAWRHSPTHPVADSGTGSSLHSQFQTTDDFHELKMTS